MSDFQQTIPTNLSGSILSTPSPGSARPCISLNAMGPGPSFGSTPYNVSPRELDEVSGEASRSSNSVNLVILNNDHAYWMERYHQKRLAVRSALQTTQGIDMPRRHLCQLPIFLALGIINRYLLSLPRSRLSEHSMVCMELSMPRSSTILLARLTSHVTGLAAARLLPSGVPRHFQQTSLTDWAIK